MNHHQISYEATRAIHEARIAELKASAREVRYQSRRHPLASVRRIFSAEYARIERIRTQEPVQSS